MAQQVSGGERGSHSHGVTRWRITTAARVFTLSAALGLTLLSGGLPSLTAAFLALCALAALMSVPLPTSLPQIVMPVAEGAIVALMLASTGGSGVTLYVYLVVPPFVAGVQSGIAATALVTTAECAAEVAVAVTSQDALLGGALERTAPWLLVGLGLGLLGAWMRSSDDKNIGDQARYEVAHRLLGQLREVSRQLSSGLDTSTLAHQISERTAESLGATRAAVLIDTDSRSLTPLTTTVGFEENLEGDIAVTMCLESRRPATVAREHADGHLTVRTVLPLRVGSRVIGVVLTDGPGASDRSTVRDLQAHLDEQSLRLESALLFDDVRSTATLEERHRLAREIHDGIAQEVASLGYLVDELAANTASSAGEQAARELRAELSRIVSELRLSIFDLRSNINAHAGLGLALSDYAREVGKRAGMTVHLAMSEQQHRLHLHVESELLRIAQEAVTNARKHSRATNLWVTLNTESPIIMLRIEDDGIGAARSQDNHYGLRMMQERAERIGGELAISPRPRGGTSVMVTVWPSTNTTTGEQHEHLSLAR
jgi:signal transduction histidine kinase